MATLKQLASLVGGRVVGDDSVEIRQVASADDVREGEITFAVSSRYLDMVRKSPAAAVICPEEAKNLGIPLVIAAEPRIAAIQMAAFFAPENTIQAGIHEQAFIHPEAVIDPTAAIMPGAYVGSAAAIGANTILMPGCVIMDGVSIGEKCVIHPNVVIGNRCVIGDRVVIHAGSSIGADGFGYYPAGETHRKIPQLGIVEIGCDVEIGANTCIDRATVGRTTVGEGTKIDNLVQIAHNCHVGKNCILVSKVGLAGSVRLGDNCIVGARAGITDNTTVGAGSMIAGMSGVSSDLPPGSKVGGLPAVNHLEWKRTMARMKDLPRISKSVRRMEKRLLTLENEKMDGESKDE